MKVGFSPAARDDLMDIAGYIARDSPARALGFIGELESKCMELGCVPGAGAARPELGEGIRMLAHGRYLIFYREHESMLRIERIMHGARDIGSDDLDVNG